MSLHMDQVHNHTPTLFLILSRPKVAYESLKRLLHICKASGSISARRLAILTEIFHDFPHSRKPINILAKLYHNVFLSHSLEAILY